MKIPRRPHLYTFNLAESSVCSSCQSLSRELRIPLPGNLIYELEREEQMDKMIAEKYSYLE
jgi:hypothetical protein